MLTCGRLAGNRSERQAACAAERVLQHRCTHKGRELTFQYTALPSSAQGASAARLIETDCISELRAAGLSLLSVHDARSMPRMLA